MSVKDMIAAIERTHAIMGAQVQRLATVTPELRCAQSVTGEERASSSVSDLLNASVQSHLLGTATALRAMAEVQTNFDTATRPHAAVVAQPATIIAVQPRAITHKESKS